MPTASLKDFIPNDQRRARLSGRAWLPAGVLVALIAVGVLAPKLQPGPYVPRVSVVNHSDYSFDVAVSPTVSGDWTLLGLAGEKGTTSIATVYNQGSSWTFQFSVQGHILGAVTRTRADLAGSGWRVVIPDAFAATLAHEGVVPTAPSR